MLAIAVGAFEVIAVLMIALNFGVRFFAILLIFFVAATIYYFDDFWNQAPPENAKTLMDALKSLSIIGALFIIAGYGRAPRTVEPAMMNSAPMIDRRSEEHTSELQSHLNLVCRLLLEKKK